MKWILLLSCNPEWGKYFKKNIWCAFFWALSIPENKRQFLPRKRSWMVGLRNTEIPDRFSLPQLGVPHLPYPPTKVLRSLLLLASITSLPWNLSHCQHWFVFALEFIVVQLSLVLLLSSSLSFTSPPAVSWETPVEYEQLQDAADVSSHRGNRSLSEILYGNPGKLWNRN